MSRPRIELYADAGGHWRWRIAARAFLAHPPVEDVPEPTVTNGEPT